MNEHTRTLEQAIETNRRLALELAVLLHFHNEKVTLEELIKTIVGFSYKGDLRMRMKMENPAKIENLVKGNQL
jgi:translocator assembly and maintenance protein 41